MQKLKYMKGAFMKMIRDKLMVCAAFVGLVSGALEAMEKSSSNSSSRRSEERRKSPEQSSGERDEMYSSQEAQAIARSLHVKITEFIAYAEQRSETARQDTADKAKHVAELLEQNKQDEVMVEIIEMGDSLYALKTTILNKEYKGTEQDEILKNIEFIERVLRQTKSKYTQGALTGGELRDTYILMYAYLRVPGSIINAVWSRTSGGDRPPFNITKHAENLGSASERRTAKYEAGVFIELCQPPHLNTLFLTYLGSKYQAEKWSVPNFVWALSICL